MQGRRASAATLLAHGSSLVSPLAVPLLSMLAAAVALRLMPEPQEPLRINLNVQLDLKVLILLFVAPFTLVLVLTLRGTGEANKEGHAVASPPGEATETEVKAERPDSRDEPKAEEPPPESVLSTEQLIQAMLAWKCGKSDDEAGQRAAEAQVIKATLQSMQFASPAIVHRFPASVVESQTTEASTPPFSAFGRLWCLKTGPMGNSAHDMRYFCLHPHGHNDRLRCSLIFAKHGGEGFKERVVLDWPPELAGHPWGPTLSAEELKQFRQTDGSVLVMIHAMGLGSESELLGDGRNG